MPAKSKATEMLGLTFGRLTVLKEVGIASDFGFDSWSSPRAICVACRCECGKVVVLPAIQVRRGSVASCGCLRTDLNKTKYTRAGKKNSGAIRKTSTRRFLKLIGLLDNRRTIDNVSRELRVSRGKIERDLKLAAHLGFDVRRDGESVQIVSGATHLRTLTE